MLTRGSPWRPASASSSAALARFPDGPSTVQTTASAPIPASRTRSLAASGSAAHTRVPPRAAWMGVTCPGITRSAGVASAATAARIVVARSGALIPVDTPCRASIEAP